MKNKTLKYLMTTINAILSLVAIIAMWEAFLALIIEVKYIVK